jgi:hypothetical protein
MRIMAPKKVEVLLFERNLFGLVDMVVVTDPSAVILTALIIAVPAAHISWSIVVPSPTSMIVAMAGQVLGWMLGWVMLQLLATR